MTLQTIASGQLKSKRVLLRTDFNVPIQNNVIQDKTRLIEGLPTIRYLLKQGAKVIVVTHLGRPDGKVVEKLRLDPIAGELTQLLGKIVPKLSDCIGEQVKAYVMDMKDGDIVLLENVRFHREEEENDAKFSAQLADLAEIYVNDAFGTAHRAHASTEGVGHLLPAFAGLLMEKEVRVLESLISAPLRPVCLLMGGAKIDTKIGILEKFLDIADFFIIGGALANTFLAAQGFKIGTSLCEPDKIGVAKRFLNAAQSKKILLPTDVVTAPDAESQAVQIKSLGAIEPEDKILDLGPNTLKAYAETLKESKTVIWNGPMGLYEKQPFAEGTLNVARTISELKGVTTVIGGGDTIDAIHHFAIPTNKFTHVSTGGGAMLEFLQGDILPGIKVLLG